MTETTDKIEKAVTFYSKYKDYIVPVVALGIGLLGGNADRAAEILGRVFPANVNLQRLEKVEKDVQELKTEVKTVLTDIIPKLKPNE